MSSLLRGHANVLCIVPSLTDDPRRETEAEDPGHHGRAGAETQQPDDDEPDDAQPSSRIPAVLVAQNRTPFAKQQTHMLFGSS